MKKLKVAVFHAGTQHSWQTALAFQESSELAWYATTIFYKPDRWPYRIERYLPSGLKQRVQRELRRRYSPDLDEKKVVLVDSFEWFRVLSVRLNLLRFDDWLNRVNIRRAGRCVVRMLKRERVDLVWCFNTQGEIVTQACQQLGIPCVLDQTIGHPVSMDRVLGEEYGLHSDYAMGMHRQSSQWKIKIQEIETRLATKVVAGSEFCAGTMLDHGCPPEKLMVLPYGFNEKSFPASVPRVSPAADRPLRFLFVGSLDLRKGAYYLLEAFKRIPANVATLTVVGRRLVPLSKIAEAPPHIRFVPQVPRSEIARYFAEADCFVMPSLFEGSALVLYEALGAGLGIIQSKSSGFGVIDSRNGILLDNVSVDSLVEAVMKLNRNRDWVAKWSQASLEMSKDYGWSSYRAKCRELARSLVRTA